MGYYIIRRLLISVVLLVVATFVCFALVNMMGDPLADYAAKQLQSAGTNPAAALQRIADARHKAGLDQPFLVRYFTWLGHFVTGNWGTTVNPGRGTEEVRPKIMHALWITTRLVLGAEVLAFIVGVLVGVVSAVRKYTWFDYVITTVTFLLFSTPIFAIAVLLKIAGINFNDYLRNSGHAAWLRTQSFPPGGFNGSFGNQVFQYTGTFLLPTLSLMAISFAAYSRFQRASMLETLNSDYVRTARAKGISNQQVIWKHAFRNALIPVVTVASINIGAVFSGAVVTETIFNWQGMGYILVTYVNRQEPYMLLGLTVVTAIFVILFNLLADIIYTFLDPRIRLD